MQRRKEGMQALSFAARITLFNSVIAVGRTSELSVMLVLCLASRFVHPCEVGVAASLLLAPGGAEEDILLDGNRMLLGDNLISM
jgi:hypothetical protein